MTYKIWYATKDGSGTKATGCRSDEGLESPGEQLIEAANESEARAAFETTAASLREIEGWEKPDYVLTREDDDGYNFEVVTRDEA